jgi:hypothetical protein
MVDQHGVLVPMITICLIAALHHRKPDRYLSDFILVLLQADRLPVVGLFAVSPMTK